MEVGTRVQKAKGLVCAFINVLCILKTQETDLQICGVHSMYKETPVYYQNSPFYFLSVKCNYLFPFSVEITEPFSRV